MGDHLLSVLVENHAGVLSRVAGLFSRRGFNIESLAVGTTEDPDISRMTIIVEGDDKTVEQVSKQLNKLIDVIKLRILSKENSISRELSMIKVKTDKSTRSEIIQIVEIFRANIVDVAKNSLTIECSGSSEKINALIDMLKQFGIIEATRTGAIVLERGERSIKNNN